MGDTEKSTQNDKLTGDLFPPVLVINVGGTFFTTSLSTLCRYPDSLLGSMFSGRHQILRDVNDHPFIDYSPELFQHVLNFLRSEALPPSNLFVDVYHAASYFAVEPLRERLATTGAVAQMLVRSSYRDRFENYAQIRYNLIKLAIERGAMDASHRATVRFAVRRNCSNELDASHKCIRSNADFDIERCSSCSLTTADIEAAACVSGIESGEGVQVAVKRKELWETYHDDLLRCLRQDLLSDGFAVSSNSYNREFCELGCPFTVEKFEFQF